MASSGLAMMNHSDDSQHTILDVNGNICKNSNNSFHYEFVLQKNEKRSWTWISLNGQVKTRSTNYSLKHKQISKPIEKVTTKKIRKTDKLSDETKKTSRKTKTTNKNITVYNEINKIAKYDQTRYKLIQEKY